MADFIRDGNRDEKRSDVRVCVTAVDVQAVNESAADRAVAPVDHSGMAIGQVRGIQILESAQERVIGWNIRVGKDAESCDLNRGVWVARRGDGDGHVDGVATC